MEKLIKSINGQWRLEKVNDEVRNRRAQQVDVMQEKGQGDVKGNAGETIFNIPKIAKDFNPETDLWHADAEDPLHRMDEDEWNDHWRSALNNPKLNADQIAVLRDEEHRRQRVRPLGEWRQELEEKRKADREAGIAPKRQVKNPNDRRGDETVQQWHQRLIRENPHEAFRVGAKITKEFKEKDENGRLVVRHREVVASPEDLGIDSSKSAPDFSASAVRERNADTESKQMQDISNKKFLDNWKILRDKFHAQISNPNVMQKLKDSVRQGNVKYVKQFAHIIPIADKDGNIVDYNIVKKNNPSETLEQYLNPQAPEESAPNNQMGQDWNNKPGLPEDANLISADDAPQAGAGVGVGRALSPQEKQEMIDRAAGLNAPMSPEELQAAREKNERERKRIANEIAQARAVQAAAEKYK
jgi:hypothetical protein